MSFALRVAREVKVSAQVFGALILAALLFAGTISAIANLQPDNWRAVLGWLSTNGVTTAMACVAGSVLSGLVGNLWGRARARQELETLRAMDLRFATLRGETTSLAEVQGDGGPGLLDKIHSIEAAAIMEMMVDGAIRGEAEQDVIRRVFGESVAASPRSHELVALFDQIKRIAAERAVTPS